MVERTNPLLWKKIVERVKRGAKYGRANSWNARKAQYAVKLYKIEGGEYIGVKTPQNSLVRWTIQDWQYSSPQMKGKGRYLPKKVWDKLTSQEKAATNLAKKKVGHKKARYSKKVARLVRNA